MVSGLGEVIEQRELVFTDRLSNLYSLKRDVLTFVMGCMCLQ